MGEIMSFIKRQTQSGLTFLLPGFVAISAILSVPLQAPLFQTGVD
jgi:hypothetical protein